MAATLHAAVPQQEKGSLPKRNLNEPNPACGRLRRWAIRIATAVVLAAALLPLQTRDAFVDGTFYLATVHSLYVDGDFDLRDEAEQYPWLRAYSLTGELPPRGLRNPFPIGTSLMWAPFYVGFDGLNTLLGNPGLSDGQPPTLQPIKFATTFWTVIGLFVLSDLLGRLGAGSVESLLISILTIAISPLPAYLTYAPDMSHGCGFAASAIFISLCHWAYTTPRVNHVRWGLVGLAMAAVFLTRWQDGVLAIIPGLLVLFWRAPDQRPPGLSDRLKAGACFSVGAALGAAPQMLAWKSVYDSWLLVPGNAEHIGQGDHFLSLANAEPLAFFWSTWNGLFLVHPALLLCVVGLVLRWPKDRRSQTWRWALIAGVVVQITSSMIVSDWWSGGSFGQRRVISLLPIFAIGLHLTWGWTRSHVSRVAIPAFVILCVGLASWNGLSLLRLHQGALPYNPSDRSWYHDGNAYEYYGYSRRFRDIVVGTDQDPGTLGPKRPIGTGWRGAPRAPTPSSNADD